ncbi:MAG TPA: hypothetical protein VG056_02860 [Pirellulales bacterium]|nr:hypothetical protein [Pirellulales bacterium]
MIQPVGDDSQSECLRVGDGFLARCAIGHDAWQFRNLHQPSTIILSIDFY